MKFTAEQEALRKVARDFAEQEVRPRLDEIIDNQGFIPRDLYLRMGELGFNGLLVKKEYGGQELGMTELCIVTEELSKVAPTLGLILMCVAPGMVDMQEMPVFRERYLADVIAGRKVFDGGATDPAGHTNTAEWPVMAVRTEGGYIINGTKLFVSCMTEADVHEIYGLDENREMRIFVIEGDTPGFSHDEPEIKFGMEGSGGGTCVYKDVFVPDELVVPTEVGGGAYYNNIWLMCSTIALGAMEGALQEAVDYSLTRTRDFKPIAAMQAQAERIALLKCKALACNSLIFDACQDYEAGLLDQAYMKSQAAKAYVPTMAYEVTKECVKLHGGLGYSNVRYYHFFADAVGTAIADQTTEYLLETLAHTMGLPEQMY